MAILTAAVACLGTLLLLNLLLTLGLIRRFRMWTDAAASTSGQSFESRMPSPGYQIQSLSVLATDGTLVSERDVRDSAATVAFLSTGCQPCRRIHRELVNGAESQITLAFVSGIPGESEYDEFVGDLSTVVPKVARLTAPEGSENGNQGSSEDAIMAAFGGIPGFPTMLRLEDGVVRRAGMTLRSVQA